MARRRLKALTFRAQGVSDTIDGTNAFEGAMLALINLVHAPSTKGVFVPREAAVEWTGFAGFVAPGQVSALVVIGTRIYGMVASARFMGHDEPFIYDGVAKDFIVVNGVTANNTPLTQAVIGDWQPPTIAQPTPAWTLFTHPGFLGGAGPYFGWIDQSGFSSSALLGNTTSGSPVIASINDGDLSLPITDGVQPGQTISGAGIPAGSRVVSVENGTFTLATTGDTHANTTLDSLGSVVGVAVGMLVTGPQFAAGTYVAALPGGSAVTLSTAALGSASGTAVDFTGGGSITISNNATANADSVSLDIAGGTPAAPLWGAGNTNVNPLVSPPVSVAGFNNRAYWAVGAVLPFSDIQLPLNVTNADQALNVGSVPITALSGDPLTSQVTGGVVQALVVFIGASPFYLVTGDAALGTLLLNVVQGSVGTLAPNTICQTPMGVVFVSPDGVRILGSNGLCSEPLGAYGAGVSAPFGQALYPTRMCAAYGQNSIRISLQNGAAPGQPWQEYVLNMVAKGWTGPHTFAAALIASFISEQQVGFVSAPQVANASLWFHSLVPNAVSTYIENDADLSWSWQTSLLPDNGAMVMNRLLDTALGLILPPGATVSVAALDESGAVLGTVNISAPSAGPAPQWGVSIWGMFNWGGVAGFFKQWRVAWSAPVVFKQATMLVTAASQAQSAIGNLYMGYQPLRYLLEDLKALTAPAESPITDAAGNVITDAQGNPIYGVP